MSGLNCLCGSGAKNLGQPGCVETLDYPVKVGFEQRIANDGTLNCINLDVDTIDDAYMTAWLNEQDESKRLFMGGTIVNVVDERGDPITYDANNIGYIASEGNRVFTYEIVENASPQLVAAINGFSCKDTTVYTFSVSSQIGGNGRTPDKLYGYRIEKNTLYAKLMPATRDTPERIMVTFTLSILEKDEDRAFVPYTPTETGVGRLVVDPLNYDGLVDTNIGAASDITTASFVANISFDYGAQANKEPFVGGVLADFSLEEISPTPGAVVLTSVTESVSNPGEYTFVFPAETSGDILRLTGLKTGFSFNNTIDILIP